MLRFQPDTWLDGLLRPLLLADPSAGLYYEEGAPDWRFAVVVLLALGLTVTRRWRTVSPAGRGLLLGLLVVFYGWTFSIGNGRYVMPMLLLAGPFTVVLGLAMPGSRFVKGSLAAALVGLQLFTVTSMLRPGAWGIERWTSGPAVALAPSPVREQALTIVTISPISYSILVPFFHPESRWINASGQIPLRPRLPEWRPAQALLDGPLPLRLLVPADAPDPGRAVDRGPGPATQLLIDEVLGEQGLRRVEGDCEVLATNLIAFPRANPSSPSETGAFWLCPLRRATPQEAPAERFNDPYADVFDRIEAACPRHFPKGNGETRQYDGFWQRYYLGADMRLIVDGAGNVLYRYFRHFTPVRIGSVADVRQAGWSLRCDRLLGRYTPPWAQDP